MPCEGVNVDCLRRESRKRLGILSTKMITGVLDLFMKPESPLVVIQASWMKENQNSGLESDSEVDKLFRIRPTICNMYPLRIWFITSGKGSILNLTAVLGNLNQT